MAVYWNLGLLTRSHADAVACAAFFAAQRLDLDGTEVALEISEPFEVHAGRGWLLGVWPRGMSYGSPRGNDPRLTTDDARAHIARTFDAWIASAPPFAAAYFGGEAYDMFLDGAVDELDADGIEGLAIDEATWIALGSPASAHLIAPGRYAWPRTRAP